MTQNIKYENVIDFKMLNRLNFNTQSIYIYIFTIIVKMYNITTSL